MSTDDHQPGAEPPVDPKRPDFEQSPQDARPYANQAGQPEQAEPNPYAGQPGQPGQPEANPYAGQPGQPGQPEANPYAGQPGQPGQPEANPYAGQPGQADGAGYGQQPYGGVAPHDAGMGAPAPAKKKFGVREIISLIVVVGMAIGVGFFLWKQAADNNALQVGNCVVITEKGKDDFDIKKVDCDSDAPSALVVKVVNGAAGCGREYRSFEYVDKKTNQTEKSYCLMENLKVDKCYGDKDKQLPGLQEVACSTPDAFKVTKRIDNTDDISQCGAEEQGVGFPLDPKRVYCVTAGQ